MHCLIAVVSFKKLWAAPSGGTYATGEVSPWASHDSATSNPINGSLGGSPINIALRVEFTSDLCESDCGIRTLDRKPSYDNHNAVSLNHRSGPSLVGRTWRSERVNLVASSDPIRAACRPPASHAKWVRSPVRNFIAPLFRAAILRAETTDGFRQRAILPMLIASCSSIRNEFLDAACTSANHVILVFK